MRYKEYFLLFTKFNGDDYAGTTGTEMKQHSIDDYDMHFLELLGGRRDRFG